MSGYTPGPWSAKTDGKYFSNHTWTVDNDEEPVIGAAPIHANGHVIAMVVSGDMDDGIFDANARLIAAAPILLEEFQNASVQMDMAAECIEAGRYDEALLHVLAMRRKRAAAIAAATGEAA